MYPYNVARWLDGDPDSPRPPEAHRHGRNSGWRHLDAFDVLAMPDPWEYPWFAAWDLGFHAVPWAHFDPAFAKYQLIVLLREWFQHPNGALPAYEWNFDDVNPPVHVMSALRVFLIDGGTDREFLERVFQKLLINFTWWLNREDADGNNVFSGGFLGLDNISPVDRSNLPDGVTLEQADGTAWMAYYALSMLLIALALVEENDVYWDMVIKFLEQFVLVARALERQGLYDADDAFFYDRLVFPSGESTQVKVKTISGLLPLLPAVPLSARVVQAAEGLGKRFARLRDAWAETGGTLGAARVREVGDERAVLLSVIDPDELRQDPARVLRRSRVPLAARAPRRVEALRGEPLHARGHPRSLDRLRAGRVDHDACSAATRTGAAPIWMPLNYLAIRQFVIYQHFFGDEFKLEYPTGSGQAADVRADRPGPRRPDHLDLAAGARRPPAALRRHGAAPDGSGLEGQPRLQRVLPRRQRRRPRRGSPDGLDGARRGSDPRPTEHGSFSRRRRHRPAGRRLTCSFGSG